MALSLGSYIIGSRKNYVFNYFYHLPDQASELQDLPARHGILFASGNRAVLTVEPLLLVKQ